jgi:5,10-methylenetetrahydrofolate reductase
VHSKEAFNRCVDALARYNISQEKFPVIFGLMPVVSRKNGEFLNKYFSGFNVPESLLAQFDNLETAEDREQMAYEQALDLAAHFSQDGTNNYYIICPFKRFDLTAKIVEFIKFGYSQVKYRGQTIVQQDSSRKPHPIRILK